jgi:hypothetical protein
MRDTLDADFLFIDNTGNYKHSMDSSLLLYFSDVNRGERCVRLERVLEHLHDVLSVICPNGSRHEAQALN